MENDILPNTSSDKSSYKEDIFDNNIIETSESGMEVEYEHLNNMFHTVKMAAQIERRELPSRKAKTQFFDDLLRSDDKPIKGNLMKLSKNSKNIKKTYLNKKLTKFKPSNLETIYEEPKIMNNTVCLVGTRKVRRSLTPSDGAFTNKTTTQKRRAKIKSKFGRKITFKKVSMNLFLEKLNSPLENNTED